MKTTKLSRRKLMFGVAGATAILPLTYVVRVSLGGYVFDKKYSHLTDKEAFIISKLAEAVIPNENPFGYSTHDVDVVGGVNNFMAIGTTLEQGEMRILFWAVEHVFPILKGYFTKFSSLDVGRRTRLLESMEHEGRGIQKLLARACKTVVCFSYFNSPLVQEKLGLKGWCGP